MAFPMTALPVLVEMFVDGAWTSITSRTFSRNGSGISMRGGFADEATQVEPGSMTFDLNNVDGRFSPRNPTGPYYGKIGRNTPVRVRITGGIAGPRYLHCEQNNFWAATYASVTAGSLDVTTDIDVRVDARVYGWRCNSPIAARYFASGTNRSWLLLVDSFGFLVLAWSSDGTSGAVLSATSTVVAGLVDGQRKAIRATLDVDNGAAGHTVTFYTADTIDGSWVQLGSPVTTAGTTTIHNPGGATLEVGHHADFVVDYPTLHLYAVQVLNGIGGSAVADIDFTAQDAGDTSFVDDAGRTWLVGGGLATAQVYVRIVDPGIRGIGEISEWPVRWDVSGNDVWTSVTAQGVLRRLQQGQRPANSPFRSATLADATFFELAYWPMEDAGPSFANAFSDQTINFSPVLFHRSASPLSSSGTAPDFAASGPFLGSDSVAVLGATTSLSGPVPPFPFDGLGPTVGLHLSVPATTGWANNTPILHIVQSTVGSTVAIWEVRYKSGGGGDLEVRALDGAGAELATSGTLDFNVDGQDMRLHFSAGAPQLTMRTLDADGTGITEVTTGSIGALSSMVATHATQIRIAPNGGLDGLSVGQVYVQTAGTPDVSDDALLAFLGESAAIRADRLLGDAGVAARLVGNTVTAEGLDPQSEPMGVQATPAKMLDALDETWQADHGLLFESRDELGVTLRILRDFYNQSVTLTLDYTGAGEIAPDLEPTDDDQLVRNDVTATRKGGSSARFTDLTSRMGTQAPPDGVGPYETEITVNVQSDDVLIHHAGWLVHVGTWDEARFPQVRVNIAALAAAGKTDLIAAVCLLKPGDRIRLTNLPVWASVDDVDLLFMGWEETFVHPNTWTLSANTRPYGPWQVGTVAEATPSTVDPNVQRLDGSTGCAIRAALNTLATSFAFDPNVFRWTTTADHFDTAKYPQPYVMVGGERMALTNVSTTAATYVAAGAASHADNAAVTPALYAGNTTDDWILVLGRIRGTAGTLATPAGYTLLAQQANLYLWAKVHDGSETDPTLTPSGGAAGDTVSGVTFGLRGMPVTMDPDAYVLDTQSQTNASAQDIAYPTMVAAHWPGRVVLILGGKSDDWTGVAPPSGFTEAVDASTATGSDQGFGVYYRIDTTPTRVPNGSLTVTGGAGAVSEAVVVALAGGYQTATVTRSQNGVLKAHAAGAVMKLDYPLTAAL